MLTRLVAIACAFATASPVWAGGDPRGDADEHARRGVALYKLGRYGEAIEEFEQAYLLYPSDMLLYNLGQSHRQLDHCREALDYYRRFLDAQPEPALAAKVGALIPPLEHACEVKYEKPVDVASAPPPAPSPPPPAVERAVTVEAPAPATASGWKLRFGLDAGVVVSGSAMVTPIGPSFAASRSVLDGKLDVGGAAQLGLFGGAPGTTGSTVTGAATAGRSFAQGAFELRFAGGPGVVVLSSPTRELVATGHSTRGSILAPELVALGSIDYAFATGWVASAGAEVAVGASSALQAGMLAAAAVSLAIGYRP